MKRLLSLILALAMALALVACGSSNQTSGSSAANSTPASSGASSSGEAEADPFEGLPEFKLKMATTHNETELNGMIMAEFMNYVTEHTNGKVTFETFYGGILGTSQEELQLVASGSVDLVPLGHNPHAESIPLLNGPSWVNGNEEDALAYFNYLVFENEETSALIKAEAEANNIVYLGFQPSGKNVFICKEEASSFADMAGRKHGAAANHALFESLGLSIVTTTPPDMYESLSRGVIDMCRNSFTASINMKWYEVAKYWLFDGTAAAGSPFTMNLDTWNSLPAEYQEVFYAAAEYAAEYGLALSMDNESANLDYLAEKGVTVVELPAEDQTFFYEQLINVTFKTCRERAERLGIVDEMETVIAAVSDYLGIEG